MSVETGIIAGPHKVLVRPLKEPESQNGLQIIRKSDDTLRGEVIASDLEDVPEGAVVRWASEYCGEPFKWRGQEILALQREDLLGTEVA